MASSLTDNLDRTNPTERDLARELDRLKEWREKGRITEEDYERIIGFWRRYDRGENAESTQITHLSNLRTTAARIPTSLTEATNMEIKRLMADYKSGAHEEVSDDGIVPNPHQSALRVFYRWHEDLGVNPDDIDIDSDYSGRELTADDIWTQDDVEAWLEASRTGETRAFRDRAIFALALATGQRIDAIASLRLKHISQKGPTIDLQLNEEEGQLKGATGTRPVLWAKHYLRPWLDNHPHRDDPEAGLFVPVGFRGRNRKPEGGERDPLDQQTLRDIITDYADAAEIDKPTYFHILRHTAITRMAHEGVPEHRIKQIAGWDPDSSQFSTYLHLADQLNNDAIRKDLGLPTSGVEHTPIGRPAFDKCPNPACDEEIPQGRDHCPTCGEPLTYDADTDSVYAEKGDDPSEAAIQEAANRIAGVLLDEFESIGSMSDSDLKSIEKSLERITDNGTDR